MCIFTHVAAGACAGHLAPAPFLAPVFGLGSHIALDILPHYDFERVGLEILFGALVFVALAVGGAASTAVLLGAAFAVLPDLENLFWKLGMITDEEKSFPGHVGIVRHGPPAGYRNLIGQVVASIVMVLCLIGGVA